MFTDLHITYMVPHEAKAKMACPFFPLRLRPADGIAINYMHPQIPT